MSVKKCTRGASDEQIRGLHTSCAFKKVSVLVGSQKDRYSWMLVSCNSEEESFSFCIFLVLKRRQKRWCCLYSATPLFLSDQKSLQICHSTHWNRDTSLLQIIHFSRFFFCSLSSTFLLLTMFTYIGYFYFTT